MIETEYFRKNIKYIKFPMMLFGSNSNSYSFSILELQNMLQRAASATHDFAFLTFFKTIDSHNLEVLFCAINLSKECTHSKNCEKKSSESTF